LSYSRCSGGIEKCEKQVVLSEKNLNREYGTHKLQALIFWGCIQGMNQQNFCEDPLKHQFECLMNHLYDSALWNLFVHERVKNRSRWVFWFRLMGHITSSGNWTT